MRADFNAVDRLSQAVLDKRAGKAKLCAHATTAAGTNIFTDLDPGLQVVQDVRDHQPGKVGKSAWEVSASRPLVR